MLERQVNISVAGSSNTRMMSGTRSLQMISSYAHLKSNKKHSIDWEKAAFLGKERNWKGRTIKEALFINVQNSGKAGKAVEYGKGNKLGCNMGSLQSRLTGNSTKKMLGRT